MLYPCKVGSMKGNLPPVVLSYASGHLLAINTENGGHSAYDNTSPLSITIDGMTFSLNWSNKAYTCDVAGTYFYTTSAVYSGQVVTASQHAAANAATTLADTTGTVVFIPD